MKISGVKGRAAANLLTFFEWEEQLRVVLQTAEKPFLKNYTCLQSNYLTLMVCLEKKRFLSEKLKKVIESNIDDFVNMSKKSTLKAAEKKLK